MKSKFISAFLSYNDDYTSKINSSYRNQSFNLAD